MQYMSNGRNMNYDYYQHNIIKIRWLLRLNEINLHEYKQTNIIL